MYGHSRGPSELSGDGLRSELDSGGEVEPESPVLGGMWKGDQGSRDRHVTGSDTPPQVWMAPQDWASRGTKPTASDQQGPEERREEREPGGRTRPYGLGVLDDAPQERYRTDGKGTERSDVGRGRRV